MDIFTITEKCPKQTQRHRKQTVAPLRFAVHGCAMEHPEDVCALLHAPEIISALPCVFLHCFCESPNAALSPMGVKHACETCNLNPVSKPVAPWNTKQADFRHRFALRRKAVHPVGQQQARWQSAAPHTTVALKRQSASGQQTRQSAAPKVARLSASGRPQARAGVLLPPQLRGRCLPGFPLYLPDT